jgi:hypothetical protein
MAVQRLTRKQYTHSLHHGATGGNEDTDIRNDGTVFPTPYPKRQAVTPDRLQPFAARSTVLLEKLTVPQLAEKFPAFSET